MIWEMSRVCLINGSPLWKFLAKPLSNGNKKRENDLRFRKILHFIRVSVAKVQSSCIPYDILEKIRGLGDD